MKKSLTLLLVLLYLVSPAQQGVLLVPFEDKMYRSAIDSELVAANGKSQHEVMNALRKGLMVQLELAFRQNYKPQSLLAADSLSKASLVLCLNSTGLEYIPVKKIETESKPLGNRLKGAWSKEEKTTPTQSGIYNGEVVAVEDNREKYMNTVVQNPDLFSSLKINHGTTLYVFINEVNILKETGSSPFVQQNQLERVLKIHYTVFNQSGKEVCGGISETKFSGKKNKLEEIVNDHISTVAQKIYKDTFNAEETLSRVQSVGK